jgi:hypothetical protein
MKLIDIESRILAAACGILMFCVWLVVVVVPLIPGGFEYAAAVGRYAIEAAKWTVAPYLVARVAFLIYSTARIGH